MEAIPGRASELSKLLADLAKKVRAEPGNIRYYVYQAQDNGTIFYIEESYKNEKAFHDHMETEHGKSFDQAITRLVIGGKSKVIFLKDVA
ncbi:antibiotic biosynthesis monooxygenase [Acetobacteraceae bacterium]|nr:antibiotic biosynthesis monooxygenase [Acetobacteraceae bacterium]